MIVIGELDTTEPEYEKVGDLTTKGGLGGMHKIMSFIYTIKRKGDRGSPCATPILILNHFSL